MFRIFGAVFALALVAPTSAFACGMYIPEPEEARPTLASVLDSIDEAVKPADAKPEPQIANAEAEPTITVVETLEPAESNTRHAKRHKPSDS